jgi:hypothetical protein
MPPLEQPVVHTCAPSEQDRRGNLGPLVERVAADVVVNELRATHRVGHRVQARNGVVELHR